MAAVSLASGSSPFPCFSSEGASHTGPACLERRWCPPLIPTLTPAHFWGTKHPLYYIATSLQVRGVILLRHKSVRVEATLVPRPSSSPPSSFQGPLQAGPPVWGQISYVRGLGWRCSHPTPKASPSIVVPLSPSLQFTQWGPTKHLTGCCSRPAVSGDNSQTSAPTQLSPTPSPCAEYHRAEQGVRYEPPSPAEMEERLVCLGGWRLLPSPPTPATPTLGPCASWGRLQAPLPSL